MEAKLSEVSRVLRVDEIPLCQRLESDSKTPESCWFHAPWRRSRLERTYVRLVAMVAQEAMVRTIGRLIALIEPISKPKRPVYMSLQWHVY